MRSPEHDVSNEDQGIIWIGEGTGAEGINTEVFFFSDLYPKFRVYFLSSCRARVYVVFGIC